MTIMTIAVGKLDEWCMGWFAMAIRKLTPQSNQPGVDKFWMKNISMEEILHHVGWSKTYTL